MALNNGGTCCMPRGTSLCSALQAITGSGARRAPSGPAVSRCRGACRTPGTASPACPSPSPARAGASGRRAPARTFSRASPAAVRPSSASPPSSSPPPLPPSPPSPHVGEGGLQELHEIVGAGLRRELGRREAGGALGEWVGAVLEQQAADALEPRRGRLHQRRLPGVVRAAGVHQPPREHLPDERFGLRGLERRQPHRREQRRLAQGVLPVLGRPVLQEEDEGLLGGRLAFPGLGLEPLGAPVQGR
eukprot:CAMPEP_0179244100 /NCGR_PEP_ID=MMETSP0797-20121207/17883_1 /TAXON_ID=47934 /ORGANISM="Dinophysis acuminata, Strain DAEP01" /LENGTH=246 /DNA_ID=CAMNT_0020951605 /DNA_START=80 /DNA_END=817 /DNA_ORIENTATION=-